MTAPAPDVTNVRPLLIMGTYLLAQELTDQVDDHPAWTLAGFIENYDRTRCDAPFEGLPVHWVDDIAPLAATHWAICGISTTKRTGFIAQVAARGMLFATLVHPTARVSRRSTLGAGSIVSPGVIVAAHTEIGRHVFLNRGVLIGHDTTIGDYATVQPGANIAGVCRIGERVTVGMGAIIQDHITVGVGAVIGAGAVVTKDIPAHALATGVPARVIRTGIDPT